MLSRAIFQVGDYLVVAAMLSISGVIGIYFRFSGGKQKTTSEYLMAGRDMAILPVTLSLMATTQTAVGTLGFPGEIYLYGAQLFLYPLGFVVALIICTYLFTPVYFGIQVTSAYEYLERRFGKVTRTVISGLFIIQMVLFMSVGLYSPSIALSAVSGLSHLVSILSVGAVCAFYCTLGGMKAVLWTDVFQSILMFLALFSVVVKGSLDLGGFQNMIEIARAGKRLEFFNLSPDPTIRFTVMSSLIGGFMYGITTCGANQTQVQRMLTLKTLKRSQLALMLSIPLNLIMYYTTFMCGVVIYSNFASCDPLLRSNTTGISSADQLIPYYMITSFSGIPGMAGFCVSGVFCAALTSISSAVNSLAAVTIEDFVKPFCDCGQWLTDSRTAKLSKFFALFYSALCIAMTYVVGNIEAIIPAAFVVFTAIGGPTLSIIMLGMLTASANQKGILVGLLSGIVLNAWIGTGSLMAQYPQTKLPQSIDSCPASNITFFDVMNVTSPHQFSYTVEQNLTTTVFPTVPSSEEIFILFKLSFYLHPVPGTILTFLVGYLASLITGGNKGVDRELLSPVVRRWLSPHANSNGNINTRLSSSANGMNGINTNHHPEQNGKITDTSYRNEITEESKL